VEEGALKLDFRCQDRETQVRRTKRENMVTLWEKRNANRPIREPNGFGNGKKQRKGRFKGGTPVVMGTDGVQKLAGTVIVGAGREMNWDMRERLAGQ